MRTKAERLGKPLRIVGATSFTPKKSEEGMSEPNPPVRLESEFFCVWSISMAPRANWKGFLRLSLVTCPVALYPATSDSEKISFNQINRKTGHRIKYAKVDADTGEEVANEDITKGYKVDTDTYVEVSKDELDNIALESTRTIDIDEFVPKTSIDPRYLIRPYYLVPDGKVGHDAFAVKRSISGETTTTAKKPRKASASQKEMLLPIAGKKARKEVAKKNAKPQRRSA
jgi:DNA end-binding protein Ku